jgi:hypothetical protein
MSKSKEPFDAPFSDPNPAAEAEDPLAITDDPASEEKFTSRGVSCR